MTEEPTFPSGVSINLDRERRIKYGHNALCEFENAMGKPIGASLTSEEQIGFSTIRALLWAGLLWEEPTLPWSRPGHLLITCQRMRHQKYMIGPGTWQIGACWHLQRNTQRQKKRQGPKHRPAENQLG